jgi:hypothetical protein
MATDQTQTRQEAILTATVAAGTAVIVGKFGEAQLALLGKFAALFDAEDRENGCDPVAG